ncbi:MAG: lipoprotein signal peptidase [Candidatus Saganbacteria bacterium]|uniref:Lipoprotein signal peptidase n=1 Tax=Candidatus Saganbacteria bacterium TaxID=2575572 RepID=A0A833NRT2_UNCSA|nr:MAG: lipoprotein signal peptidase [Candidatus Saganbacteria bacterium]
MFYLSAALIFILDQLTKYVIVKNFLPNQSMPIIRNILHLTYVQNRGAAFGIFNSQRSFLLVVGVLLIGVLFYFHLRVKRINFAQVPLGLVLGGAAGNILDRLVRHYVVDFIDFRVWPVFNIADIMINVGVFLIILMMFFKKEDISSPFVPLTKSEGGI